MKFYPYLPGPIRLHKADWLVAVIGNLGVWPIMAYRQVIPPGKLNNALEETRVSDGAGGVVGIAHPQQFCLLQDRLRDGFQVREKAVLRGKRHIVRLTAGQHGAHRVNRIGRVGHQRRIAGVDKAQGDMGDTFF